MKKIMIIDDDEIHLAIVDNMLKDRYEIITALSGKQGLDQFFHGTFPDLIFLDILMPDMDGWETYNRIKALSLLKNIPIAFFTSVLDDAEREHAFKIGAADFITKPYGREDLIKRIESILDKSVKKAAKNSRGARKIA